MKSTFSFIPLISLLLLDTTEGFVVSTLFNIFSFISIPILNELIPDSLADVDPYTIDRPVVYTDGTIDTDCGEQSVTVSAFVGDIIGLSTLQVDTFDMVPFTFGFEPGLFSYSAEFEGEGTLDLTAQFIGNIFTSDISICASTSVYAGETTFSGLNVKFTVFVSFDYNLLDSSVTINDMQFDKFTWDAKEISTSLETGSLGNFTGATNSEFLEDWGDELKEIIDRELVQDVADEILPYTTGEEE